MAKKYTFEAWDGKFLRACYSEQTEKQAYLESGKWKNCTHFRLTEKGGKIWTEWGKRPNAD